MRNDSQRTMIVTTLSVGLLMLALFAPLAGSANTEQPTDFDAPVLRDGAGRTVEEMLAATGLAAPPGASAGEMYDGPRPDHGEQALPLGGAASATGGLHLWEARYEGNAAGWSITHDIAVDRWDATST